MILTNRILIISFYIIFIITLVFGLWPLNLWPQNEVQWLDNQRGIEMHRSGIEKKYAPRGIVYSNGSFLIPLKSENEPKSFSIEIYLQSKKEPKYNLGTIITFSENQQPASFLLAQWKKTLVLRTPDTQSEKRSNYIEVGLSNALPRDSTRFLTITSGYDGTRFYLNGEFKKHSPNLYLVSDNKSITGKIILGNSASGRNSWAGKIFGIGIYEDELLPQKIKQHYQSWRSNDPTILSSEENIVALYTFDEGQGVIARNSVSQDKQLIIPERFIVLEKTVLEPPWAHFNSNFSFIFDFTINLLGFIPLGIILTLYLRRIFRINGRRLFLISLMIGGAISLMIELLQALMPQRHSSLMDLILNIAGLCIGILLVRFFAILKRKLYAY